MECVECQVPYRSPNEESVINDHDPRGDEESVISALDPTTFNLFS